ncbi:MAG: small acid-soluble spore protein Tlp [Bacillales bacterium]|jgi:small acid-soluble spore protein (thioredoxin-like protein)|nr:small acid-soluble spore protein Tlp [Bacillales bacterium]
MMAKPDDRSDNVEKLQGMIEHTLENVSESKEALSESNAEERRRIHDKNLRRMDSIKGFRAEIADEIEFQKKNKSLDD